MQAEEYLLQFSTLFTETINVYKLVTGLSFTLLGTIFTILLWMVVKFAIDVSRNRSGNCFKEMEEEYFEKLQEREDEEMVFLKSQQENLKYLEDMIKKENRTRKIPYWRIYTLFALIIWSIFFYVVGW
jgi:hypothetical protein